MTDIVFEGARVKATIEDAAARVWIDETQLGIVLTLPALPGRGNEKRARLTTEQARAIAAQLYRLAKRVDDRLIKKDTQS